MRSTGEATGPPWSESWLLGILASASSPQERLAGGWLTPADRSSGDSRYRAWLDLVADGDRMRGADILRVRGLDVDEFVRSLGDAHPVPGAALPDWAQAACELIEHLESPGSAVPAAAPPLSQVTGPGLPDWVDGSAPWRFYPGFAAWMSRAGRLVSTWSAIRPGLLAPAARRELVLALPRAILTAIGPRLMAEADARATDQALFSVDPVRDWREILTRYPVIARVLAVLWLQWRATTKEIIDRIAADLPKLAPGGHVAALVMGAGDRHAGGRSVTQLVLDCGSRLYLKPRPVGPYRVLRATLDAVDTCGEPLGLSLPSVAVRPGYAWSVHLDPQDCTDEQEVSAYFYRTGAMLRILQTLGATDLHQENFVPTRTQPVLVDLETVMNAGSGWGARFECPDPEGLDLAEAMADTPAATSMVTSALDGSPGSASCDIGALAGPSARPTPYTVLNLVPTGSGPQVRGERLPMETGMALPRYQGTGVPVRRHVPSVVAGYREAARRLATHVDLPALLGADSLDEPVRFVPRATQIYSRLLQQSLSDRALSDGAERELVLERLWLAIGTCPADLIEAEQESLRELDVPLFTVGIGSTDLVSDRGRVIPSALSRPPVEVATHRFARMVAEPDQLDDLLAALFAVDPDAPPAEWRAAPRDATAVPAPPRGATAVPAPPRGATAPPRDASVADAIGSLLDLARPLADGTVAWSGLDYDPARFRWRHARLGPGLLGEAGIGLVLASVGTLLPDAPPASGPIGVATLLGAAARARRAPLTWTGSNAFTGPSGTVYALARAAGLTGDERLLDAAVDLLPSVLAAAREARTAPVIDGVAGGVLACLHLPRTPARERILDELATLLRSADSAADTSDDLVTRWSLSLPSPGAGHELALHRLSTGAVDTAPGGSTAPAWSRLTAGRPGDAVAAAALGETGGPLWPDPPVPLSTHDWLDRAETARAGSSAGPWPDARADLALAVKEIETGYSRTGTWFPDVLAPDTHNLSALHGLAAIALLSLADHTSAPNVRVLG